jgi:DNA-binding response OmpR family regulator
MATTEDGGMGSQADWVMVMLPRRQLLELVAQRTQVETSTSASWPGDAGHDHSNGSVGIGALSVDAARRTVRWGETPIPLSQREIDLLDALCVADLRARRFDELVEAAWKVRSGIGTDVVHHAVKRLRRKLERHGVTVRIESVAGFGFRIVAS